eukprot:m.441980 g.441980  ORF g.441980 m.441980 type:complete len:170 (+) comp21471_c0_seq7:823-1332(+)
MTDTARGMIENFAVTLVARYGMVPNGGRVYYTRRSQPPVLSLMVEELFAATANTSFLAAMLPHLVDEHGFWMHNRSVTVGNATLNQYRYADIIKSVVGAVSRKCPERQQQFWESGWQYDRVQRRAFPYYHHTKSEIGKNEEKVLKRNEERTDVLKSTCTRIIGTMSCVG